MGCMTRVRTLSQPLELHTGQNANAHPGPGGQGSEHATEQRSGQGTGHTPFSPHPMLRAPHQEAKEADSGPALPTARLPAPQHGALLQGTAEGQEDGA